MTRVDFESLPLGWNLALFAIIGGVVWLAGTRLAVFADELAERTQVGRVFVGLVLLAGITELPELVTSLTAVAIGDASLAVNNLFGGIVMQTAILAVADMLLGRGALSFFTPKPELLLQGVLLTVLLAFALTAVTLGDVILVGTVGVCTTLFFVGYLFGVWLLSRFNAKEYWLPVDLPSPGRAEEGEFTSPFKRPTWTLRRIGFALGAIGVVILVAGALLVEISEAIAIQSGLGSSYVGATLLAATTSLPELSTTLAAVRLRAYDMAFANIFGSNAIVLALLFVADAFYADGPILAMVDRSATFAAAVGIVVTGIYLVGLIARRQRVVLRMGVDSLAVLVIYAATLFGLYHLRNG